MFDPTNIIIMRKQLEVTFDKWDWTIIPEGPDHYKVRFLASIAVLVCEKSISKTVTLLMQIQVLNPEFLQNPVQQYIDGSHGKGRRWCEINNSFMPFPSLARPARRLCALHAQLAIENAEGKGWITEGYLQVSEAGWESPSFDKGLMDQFLRGSSDEGDSQLGV